MIMNYSYIPLFKDMPVLIKLITANYMIVSDYDSQLVLVYGYWLMTMVLKSYSKSSSK